MNSISAANHAIKLFEKFPFIPKEIREFIEQLIRSNFKYEKELLDLKKGKGND